MDFLSSKPSENSRSGGCSLDTQSQCSLGARKKGKSRHGPAVLCTGGKAREAEIARPETAGREALTKDRAEQL